ncbi:hypothetical protein D9M71_243320 [compost metagenome]
MGQLPGFQGVEGEVDVGILVVEERPEDALGQAPRFVGELLAGLVEEFLDISRPGGIQVLQLHGDEAGLGDGFHPVVQVQFLQALFQTVGHLLLHFPRGGARPGGGDGHGLDREGRVLGTAQLAEGDGAGSKGGEDQEQGDGPVAHREGGEVEAAHLTAPGPAMAPAVHARCPRGSAGGRRGRRCVHPAARRLREPPLPVPGAPRARCAAPPCHPH